MKRDSSQQRNKGYLGDTFCSSANNQLVALSKLTTEEVFHHHQKTSGWQTCHNSGCIVVVQDKPCIADMGFKPLSILYPTKKHLPVLHSNICFMRHISEEWHCKGDLSWRKHINSFMTHKSHIACFSS